MVIMENKPTLGAAGLANLGIPNSTENISLNPSHAPLILPFGLAPPIPASNPAHPFLPRNTHSQKYAAPSFHGKAQINHFPTDGNYKGMWGYSPFEN